MRSGSERGSTPAAGGTLAGTASKEHRTCSAYQSTFKSSSATSCDRMLSSAADDVVVFEDSRIRIDGGQR